MKAYRMGSKVFRKIEHRIAVLRDSLKQGFDIHSESGRITHVNDVLGARTRDGEEVLIAENGAEILHPEHGSLELPSGVYAVDQVREARPEEERARTIRFEAPAERPTALLRHQVD